MLVLKKSYHTTKIRLKIKIEDLLLLQKYCTLNNLILIIADLTIGKGPFKATYKSDVRFNKDTDTIHVTNIKGPLKHLDNKWVFLEKNGSTEISFDIDFEIENKFLNIVMNKSFQYGLDKIADSFQKRANDLFKGR